MIRWFKRRSLRAECRMIRSKIHRLADMLKELESPYARVDARKRIYALQAEEQRVLRRLEILG